MPAQLSTIPLNLIQPHPKLAFRFTYDVTGLADSIRAAADENTPNGQLNPGRVVLRPGGEGYFVYIGVRRYYALKQLYESTKDEGFGSYIAYVDTGMTELQMFVKAKRENDEERSERLGLSVLEELFGITRIRDAITLEGLDSWLKKLVDVADKMTEERFHKLYEIEVASHFKFRLPHLDFLCGIAGEEDFFLTAATTAGFGYTGEDMDRAWEDRKAAHALDWFRRVFPGYAPATHVKGRAENPEKNSSIKSKPEAKKDVKGIEIHEKGVIPVPCPRCGSVHMVEVQGKIEATHLSPDPGGESQTEVMESVSKADCTCYGCKGEFFLFVKHMGGKVYAVEPSPSMKFREPRETVEAVDLRFDSEKNEWQKIVGEKIVGPLVLREKSQK
jgi:hypothetical protein